MTRRSNDWSGRGTALLEWRSDQWRAGGLSEWWPHSSVTVSGPAWYCLSLTRKIFDDGLTVLFCFSLVWEDFPGQLHSFGSSENTIKKSMLSWSGESPLRGWERAGWRRGRCRAWRTTSRRLAASRWRWAASNLKAQQSWEQLSVFTSLWGKDPFDFLCYSHLVSSGHGKLKIWCFGQLTIKGVRVDGVQINGQVSNIGELNGHIPNLLLTYNVVSTSRMVRLTSITMST